MAAANLNRTGASVSDTLAHKSVIEKQRSAIEKLRTQNTKLKEELLLENKFSVQPSTQSAATLISKLQDEADLFTRKIELEKRKVGMLEQRLDEVTNKLTTTRRRMGGINSAKEQNVAIAKQIKILENRMEKAYIKFNEAITHNKQLREQIDNLRRERMMFENINSSLERELQRMKKEMAETIEQTSVAHETREKAMIEMGQLKLQADKEQQAFEDEWKALTAIIEEDRRAREKQRQHEMAERERKTQELLRNKEASDLRRQKTVRGQWGVAGRGTIAQNVSMEKVQQYGQAFEKIQQATGIKDIDELVSTFVNAEDQNYTLFNYVNEVNAEIEKLEDQILVIKAEIEKFKGEGIEVDNAQKKVVKDAEEQLQRMEAKADLYEKRYEAALKTVSMLRDSILAIFNKAGCNTPTVRELLGDNGVTESNLLSYLGIIEQRTTELLHLYNLKKRAQEGGTIQELLLTQPLQAVTMRIAVEPPSTQEDDQDPEAEGDFVDDEKPLSREHLELRVNKNIAKKLDTAIKFKPIHAEVAGGKKTKK